MNKLLEVRDLKKHYPIRKGWLNKQVGAVKSVDGVSFDIMEGDVRDRRRVWLREVYDGPFRHALDRTDVG